MHEDALAVELQSARLVLEPLVEAHADELFEGLKDERAYAYVPNERFANVEALRTRYRTLQRRRSPDGRQGWFNWALRMRDNDTYIGYVQATVLDRDHALIGYLIFPQWWRNGYGGEAVRLLVETILASTPITTIEAEIDERNLASRALVRRLGFRADGLERWLLRRNGRPLANHSDS